MGVKCLAQEHNTMSPARARTRTARSGVSALAMRPLRLPHRYIYLISFHFILLFKLIYIICYFFLCVKVDDARGVLTALTNQNENIQVGHQ